MENAVGRKIGLERVKVSLHQSPDHSVPSAKAICKDGEIYTQGKNFFHFGGVDVGGILLGAFIDCSLIQFLQLL